MRGLSLIGAAFLCCALPAVSGAGPLRAYERIVPSGTAQPIFPLLFLSPDCKSMGPASLGLLRSPRYGRVTIEKGQDYPVYPAADPRSVCNARKLPSQRIVYTSDPGFVGEDDVALEVVGPYGVVYRGRFHITVR